MGFEEGNINGTAPGSSIVSAEMGSNPEDTQLFGNFTAAMEWFVEQNVTIINMSFGGIEDWSSLVEIAKQNAIILIGSSGNDGEKYPPSGPGAELYSIGVGAVNELDQVSYYSRNVGIDVIFGISGVYSDGGNPAPIGRCLFNRGYALGGKSLYDLPNSYYDELVQHESTHYWEVVDHEGDHVMDNDGLNGLFGGLSNWIHNDITFLLYYDTQWFNIPPVV